MYLIYHTGYILHHLYIPTLAFLDIIGYLKCPFDGCWCLAFLKISSSYSGYHENFSFNL